MTSDQQGRSWAERTAADRRAREVEEGSSAEVSPKREPVFGRTGFVGVLAMWVLGLVLLRSGLEPVGDVLRFGSYVFGTGFAVASLARKERPRFAVGTLFLLVAGPVLLWLLVTLVWFGYGLGL